MRDDIPPTEGGRGTSNPGDTGKAGVMGVDAVLESAMAGTGCPEVFYLGL